MDVHHIVACGQLAVRGGMRSRLPHRASFVHAARQAHRLRAWLAVMCTSTGHNRGPERQAVTVWVANILGQVPPFQAMCFEPPS